MLRSKEMGEVYDARPCQRLRCSDYSTLNLGLDLDEPSS